MVAYIARILPLIVILSGCTFLKETYSDMYYTPEGGLRSHRKCQKYVHLNDSLPPGINTHTAYRLRSSKDLSTGKRTSFQNSQYYIVFLDSGRALTFQFISKELSKERLTAQHFDPANGNMAFYEYEDGLLVFYEYITTNHGIFKESEITIAGRDMLKVKRGRRGNPTSYLLFSKSEEVPTSWLNNLKVNW